MVEGFLWKFKSYKAGEVLHPWPLTQRNTRWPASLWPAGFTAHTLVVATTTWTASHTWSAPSSCCKRRGKKWPGGSWPACSDNDGWGWSQSEPTPKVHSSPVQTRPFTLKLISRASRYDMTAQARLTSPVKVCLLGLNWGNERGKGKVRLNLPVIDDNCSHQFSLACELPCKKKKAFWRFKWLASGY